MRIETRRPETRYFWPISPAGERSTLTFFTVVSGTVQLPLWGTRQVSNGPATRRFQAPAQRSARAACRPPPGGALLRRLGPAPGISRDRAQPAASATQVSRSADLDALSSPTRVRPAR